MNRYIWCFLALTLTLNMGGSAFGKVDKKEIPLLSDEAYDALVKSLEKGNDCIFARTISDWTALDRQRLIIYAPSKKRPYFAKLFTPSPELRFENAIGFQSRTDGRFCTYGGDALIIDGRRYTLLALTKITAEQAQQLKKYKKAARNKKKEGS